MYSLLKQACTFFFFFCSVDKGKPTPIETDLLTRELLESNKCYIVDCGVEIFVWMGRYTSLDDRKSAGAAAEVNTLYLSIESLQ